MAESDSDSTVPTPHFSDMETLSGSQEQNAATNRKGPQDQRPPWMTATPQILTRKSAPEVIAAAAAAGASMPSPAGDAVTAAASAGSTHDIPASNHSEQGSTNTHQEPPTSHGETSVGQPQSAVSKEAKLENTSDKQAPKREEVISSISPVAPAEQQPVSEATVRPIPTSYNP